MLLDTQINIPSQDPMADQNFSLAPRKVRKWLKALPYIENNVAAQQFYDGLRRANRQAHGTKERLDSVELMRTVARNFLKEQRKYLLAQTFPLSKKATETLKLQQNILSELAVAYKIIIQEAVSNENGLSKKKLLMCVHRAMRYMLEQYVTLAQVYSEPPQGYWQDYCQLYKMSEQLNLSEIAIKNESFVNDSKTSPNCLFKQACLLSLANLHTLGHGEAEKISAYLEGKHHLVTLTEKKQLQDDDTYYFINLILNKPPRLMSADEVPISSENRYIDPSKLINELRESISNDSDAGNEVLLASDKLNKSLSERLLNKLTIKSKRTQKRATCSKGTLDVVLGLRDTINTLLLPKSESHQVNPLIQNTNLDLLPINSHQGSSDSNSAEIQATEVDKTSSAWDWVSRGNVITESFSDRDKTSNNKFNDSVKINPVTQVWEISNASNGGYCLQSKNTSDYQSQVGDLVLFRLSGNPKEQWRIGVVRWMQSMSEQGVKIGIETFNGMVRPVQVVDAHFSMNKFKGLEHILQLVEESKNGKLFTLIAPPNSIKQGECLDINFDGDTHTIRFENSIERTISFVRFTYLDKSRSATV